MAYGLLLLKTGYVTWLWSPINFLFLLFDGITYTLVAVAYKVFQLMTQLNFNTLGLLFSSLYTRIRAIIAVLILFIIGYALVQYLINPDKASDKNKAGGVAIIKNIAIASILLISYTAIFGIMNELTMLMVGSPAGYDYVYLGPLFGVDGSEEDEGLIMRFINGGNGGVDDETEEVDFGRKLAITTLSSFLHGYEEDGLYSRSEGYDKSVVGSIFSDALKSEDFNIIFTLPSAVSSIGITVEYWPLISTALGAYIIYMLITVSIELGIRAFKLLVLQIVAPIAIITIMKDGWGSSIWGKYLKVLGKTYADAFIRIGAMYFAFSFITIAFNNLGQIVTATSTPSKLTTIAVRAIVIVAVLKLGKEIPKVIDEIFGTKLAENNKTGLTQFLGAAGGYVLGTGAGAISGAVTRARKAKAMGGGLGKQIASGFGGAIDGGLTGGFSGAAGGFTAKGGSIAEIVKNSSTKGWETGGIGMKGYVAGMEDKIGIGVGKFKRETEMLDHFEQKRKLVRAAAGTSHAYDAATTEHMKDIAKSVSWKTSETSAARTELMDNISRLTGTNAVKFNFATDKATAVDKALMENAEYRYWKHELDTDSISQEDYDKMLDLKAAYEVMYDRSGGEIDRSSPELLHMGKQISRTMDEPEDNIFDKGKTLGTLRNKIALQESNRRGFDVGGSSSGGKK